MREKIKVPKVNDYCSVSKLQEWKVELGDCFESGDVVCVINNLSEKHEIKAPKAGMLVEKKIYENAIVEDSQVIGIFEISPEEVGAEDEFFGSGVIAKFISKLKESKNVN